MTHSNGEKTGGPAFPLPTHTRKWDESKRDYVQVDGMTLRDYFAAKAMQEFVGVCDYKEGAIRAYKWADAMLEARNV